MKVIEQDPALAAAGSRLTCVVGVSGAGNNRAVSTAMASSFLNTAGRLGGDDQRADRGGPAGAAGAGTCLPCRVAAGPGRAGTYVGAGLGPRRGDLDPHPGHGGRAVTLPGAPARGRCDVDELARARRAGDLDTAAVLPDRRAERRRRLAEPDLEFRVTMP